MNNLLRIKTNCTVLFLLCCSLTLTNCINKDALFQDPKAEIEQGDFFDFNTSKRTVVTLNLGVTGETTFHLYAENPFVLDEDESWILNEDAFAFYADVTDASGNFNRPVTLPAFIQKVWLVVEHVYLPLSIELDVVDGSILYQPSVRSVSRVQSRAVMDGVAYPDGYDILGDWNSEGIPTYLLDEPIVIPPAFLLRCNTLYKAILANNNSYTSTNPTTVENSFWNKYKDELETTGTNDMVITKNTKLVASYFSSTSAWENMVAYYTYQEGETVTLSDLATIKKTILFPRYSNKAPKELLGQQVELRYWNKETESYQDEFPAGTHIGFMSLGMGFGKTSLGNFIRYSNPAFNEKLIQNSVLMQDPELDNCFFMAIEDNTDYKFNDILFSIVASEDHSVEGAPTIPDIAGSNEVSYQVKGTLAYEDFWPAVGDYDMNDVVIEFISTLTKNKSTNRVTKTTTTFTPVNNGASYTNGFGFQLDNIRSSHVTSVLVSQEGNILTESLEEGTEKPVVILSNSIGREINKPIRVELEFQNVSNVTEENVLPPYNPFIFVVNRSHEVHLTGYEPTSKADDELRGSEDDIRQDKNGNPMYYVATNNMPFALYLNGVSFKYPSEREDIRIKYPRFENWINSFGEEDADWYQ